MDFKYSINNQRGIVFLHFYDALNDETLISSFNTVHTDPDYSPTMDQCIDYTDVTDWSVSRNGINELSSISEKFNYLNNSRKSYIVAPDDLIYGYARMYQLLCDEYNEEIIITRSQEALFKLLGISTMQYPFIHKEYSQ